MKVSSIQSNIITPKTTGYAAALGLGLTVISGMSKNNSIRKVHKPLAIFSILSAILHLGLIEYYHYKFKVK